MSNSILEGLIKEKDFTFKKSLFKVLIDFKLNVGELSLLIYFLNHHEPSFDLKEIKKVTLMEEKLIMESFASLTTHNLVRINTKKGADGKLHEVVDLTGLYQAMVSDITVKIKENTKDNIFSIFEKEFGRPLTPMEFEIINAWLKADINEELIIGALKEATFNGVSNLRYIDKIIYEWGKKGFKSMKDVEGHIKKIPKDEKAQELFDYNWLDEDE